MSCVLVVKNFAWFGQFWFALYNKWLPLTKCKIQLMLNMAPPFPVYTAFFFFGWGVGIRGLCLIGIDENDTFMAH